MKPTLLTLGCPHRVAIVSPTRPWDVPYIASEGRKNGPKGEENGREGYRRCTEMRKRKEESKRKEERKTRKDKIRKEGRKRKRKERKEERKKEREKERRTQLMGRKEALIVLDNKRRWCRRPWVALV